MVVKASWILQPASHGGAHSMRSFRIGSGGAPHRALRGFVTRRSGAPHHEDFLGGHEQARLRLRLYSRAQSTAPALRRLGKAARSGGLAPAGSRMSDLVGLFNLLAPFFGLIALGFFCGKTVRRPESGLAWMQFFLVYAALPCLFYRLIADKPLEQLLNWSYVLATTLCTALAFALSFGAGLWHTRGDMPQAVMQGVAGSYSNIGYMGPPLVLSAIGPAASAPVALIFVFDSLLLFSLVPLLMALA